MNRWLRFTCCVSFGILLVFVTLSGCTNQTVNLKKNDPKTPTHADHGQAGPHGGLIAEWEEIYHAEFTVDHAKKQVVVYILDDKAKAAPKIDAAKITKVQVTITEPKQKDAIELAHDAKLSSAKGIAFVGTHEVFAKAADMKLAISGNVDGKRYVGDVTYEAPKKAALYLKPGGIYTAADVKANGATTPTEKFKGKEWAHEDNLKPGDKLCPVTKNKAEADCAWIVQGQRYEFCCPPCLDKFIGWAHFQPDKVKNANEYVYSGK